MHLKFLPYKLEPCIANFRHELDFIGVTYYERYLVFEHKKKLIDKVLGFDVTKVELSFSVDNLVGVWLYLNEKNLDDLLLSFETYFDEKATKYLQPKHDISTHKIDYYWKNDVYIIGLGINVYYDMMFVYVAPIKCNSYQTNDELTENFQE